MAYIKYARTASGGVSVQVVRYKAGRIEVLKHFGTAHNDLSLDHLIDQAEDFLGANAQLTLDIGVEPPARSRPRMADISNYHDTADSGQGTLDFAASRPAESQEPAARNGARAGRSPRVVASPARLVWDVLDGVYRKLGFDEIGDETFAATVIARMVEPSSKMQVRRIIGELGRVPMHYNTVYNALRRCIERDYYQHISRKCHAYVRQHHQVTMVLYDVTTLYFETPKEDELRKIGMSKERRVDPQIVVGLVTDNNGFPLHIDFFHGRTAETTTLIPMITAYQHAHDLQGLTVVADAAMLSAGNLDALDAAGIDYIVADRLKKALHMVTISDDGLEEWSKRTDTYEVVESTKAMGPKDAPTTRRLVVGFSPKRYKYDVYSLGKQKEKAEDAVNGTKQTRLPRFVSKAGAKLTVNEKAYDKALSLAGWKGYVTSLSQEQLSGREVISFYHELYHIENDFRMAKTDLQARPIFHRTQDAIRAHLTVVMAALAMSKHIYLTSGVTAPKLVERLKELRHATVDTGTHRYDIPPNIDEETTNLITTILED